MAGASAVTFTLHSFTNQGIICQPARHVTDAILKTDATQQFGQDNPSSFTNWPRDRRKQSAATFDTSDSRANWTYFYDHLVLMPIAIACD
tara:strand:- start:677 stop:946 length:270 start_codon:yes stop_codon:yes gene_type:complete